MENEDNLPKSVKSLILSNRLLVKAFDCPTKKKLHFVILNESKHVLSYDRAFLWDISGKDPSIQGISGLVDIDKNTELITAWTDIIRSIPNKNSPRLLDEKTVPGCTEEWKSIRGNDQMRFYWLPIYSPNALLMGLVVSFPAKSFQQKLVDEEIDIFMNFLMPGYAAGLEKFSKKQLRTGKKKKRLVALGGIFALLLFGNLYQVPLRIVSSCEVVSREPVIIAAPLEGVIQDIKVFPGDQVAVGDLLVEYEKSTFVQDLQLAKKEVELREAEVSRAKTLGYDDDEKLAELKVLMAKNDQAQAKLDFARYQFDLLTVEAPAAGIISVDNPEEWKGRPVSVGEKILSIDQQDDTKVLIWLAEGDNVNLDKNSLVKVVLNANPNATYEATLDYVSSISRINDQNIVSFEAEASWVEQPENIKIGQKGVAIMYGDQVSLLYYLFRKPYLFFRRTFGY